MSDVEKLNRAVAVIEALRDHQKEKILWDHWNDLVWYLNDAIKTVSAVQEQKPNE